jgi:hypothetical protein
VVGLLFSIALPKKALDLPTTLWPLPYAGFPKRHCSQANG